MIRAAALAAALLFAASAAVAAPFVDVDLAVDVAAGRVTGTAQYPDGSAQTISIRRPRLDAASEPFAGYIGPDDALLPTESGWLPALAAGADGWRVAVRTTGGFVAAPYPGGAVEALPAGGSLTTFELSGLAARAPLVIGRFQVTEQAFDGYVVRAFFTARNARFADAYIASAEAAISALSARIGPYPYPAFSIVESPLPIGLGYPGFTLVSSRILPLPFMRGRSLWHEIAHVWWGNGVFVDYAAGNWAEGFASFFADYALAERDGADPAREMRYDWLLEYDAVADSRDFALRAFVTKTHGQDQAIGYGKAAMTLFMLRDRIGPEAFDAGIKRFWRENRFQRAGWDDIQAAFEAESGHELNRFFRTWLDQAGAAPADPDDRDFRIFRRLAANERIPTLRLAMKADSLKPTPLAGAPGDAAALAQALAGFGQPGAAGMPALFGDRAALEAATGRAPPVVGPAIWIATDASGQDVLAVAAGSLDEAAALLRRARHYGRWSWLVAGEGRPARGRWEIDGP